MATNFSARIKNLFYKAGRQIPDEDAILYQQGEVPDDWMRTPDYFDSIKKPKDSGMGYVQSPYTSQYTKTYGVVPIADLSNYREMYRTVPIIKAAIDTTVNCACGKGFDFVCEDKEVQEYLTDYFNKLNTTELLHIIAHDCLVYGNAFVELCYERIEEMDIPIPKEWLQTYSTNLKTYKHFKGTGKVVWLKNLDPYYMRVRRDAFDNIFGYVQWITFPPVSFSTEKIAHFKYLPKSWNYESSYGTSTLMTLIKVQDYIWQLERDFQAIVHTFAKPIMAFYGGTADKPFSKAGMTDLKNAVKSDGVAGKYFLRGDCILKTEQSPANLIGISNWFNYLNEQRLAPLGVPPVLMGMTEGTNRATAQVTFADFVTRVKMLQSIIADVFEDQILPKILKAEFGEDVIVPKMIFKEIFTKDYVTESQRVIAEVTAGIISKNEAREALGYKPTENPDDNVPITLYQYGQGDETEQEESPTKTPDKSPTPEKASVLIKEDKNEEVIIAEKKKIRRKNIQKPDDNKLISIETQNFNVIKEILAKSEESILALVKKQVLKTSKNTKKKAQDEDISDIITLGLMVFSDYEIANIEKEMFQNINKTYKLGISRAEEDIGKKVELDDKEDIDNLTKDSVGYISGLNDEMQDRLRTTIADGIKAGLTYPELSVLIQEDFDFAENRAKLISITELERSHNNAYISSAESLGIEKFIWNISPDDKVCEICMGLDGTEISLEESYDAIPSKSHPTCRCFLSSYIEE